VTERRRPQRSPPKRRRPKRSRSRALRVGLAILGMLVVAVGCLWTWAVLPGPGDGARVQVDWPEAVGARQAGDRLAASGLIQSPRLFALYVKLVRPSLDFEAGPHVLNDALSPRELVRRLARMPSRPVARVTVPEGYHLRQIAERLDQLEVCPRAGFVKAAHDASLLRELGLRGPSVEGFLFPATYELGVDSAPEAVIRGMVRTFRKRLERLDARHAGALARLRKTRGWSEHEIVTLASIVEKEARHADEGKTIASVYYNRLDDPDFRPQKMLMADPTAGYGCVAFPAEAPSCAGYAGKITPALLRDAANRYNTYKHPGLPPGPIANPGESALEAVLAPEKTDYLFFVAGAAGRHRFSRTLDEHNAAMKAD
jgi:UPF0755 protein